MEERIFENDLRLPALYIISLKNGNINTTELSQMLREILKPSGEDLEILSNRNDDYFSQIVRNLTASTRPFVKNGFIVRDAKSGSPLSITEKGRLYLSEHKFELKYLLTNDFQYSDIKDNLKKIETGQRKIQTFDENIIVSEGMKKIIETQVYERSTRLRAIAIDHYSKAGKIYCDTCKFNFEDFYGQEIGKGYIEIHHVKPVFKYEGDELDKVITDALNNVIPVCSNCHRMIHRTWKNPLQIDYLIAQINANGVYNRAN